MFVVLTSPRTGSAWLMDTLDQHPAVVAHSELFHLDNRGAPMYGPGELPFFAEYAGARRRPVLLSRLGYLRLLRSRYPGARSVGFKLMYGQEAAQPGLLALLAAYRARVVHLVRTNTLDALVSYQVVKAAGSFHPRHGDDFRPRAVRLETAWLAERLEERDRATGRARERLRRHRLPSLELAYEDLVEQRDRALGSVLVFLGVDPDADRQESAFVRTPSTRDELVSNLDEVRVALAGTPYAWMVDQPRPETRASQAPG